jgi:hypothetical protein
MSAQHDEDEEFVDIRGVMTGKPHGRRVADEEAHFIKKWAWIWPLLASALVSFITLMGLRFVGPAEDIKLANEKIDRKFRADSARFEYIDRRMDKFDDFLIRITLNQCLELYKGELLASQKCTEEVRNITRP